VETAFVRPLKLDLDDLRQALRSERVMRTALPRDLVQEWVAQDGRERVEATPKGDPNDSETLRHFASAVLAAEPRATGQAVDTVEWARTILSAFVQAGACALLSITILLWIVLRRFSDVMLTLIPLLVAAAVTLEICALSGFALNYANIIALPVLLGVGVAFKIYYVMEWRRGETNFLQSSLTRAVFFSALMTATAFGSLWLSRHPGMSSMGKLLALSLLCTLAAAALYQPALMGPPRKVESAGRARQLSSSPAE
jgi:predicted RND superfamily exporter protein